MVTFADVCTMWGLIHNHLKVPCRDFNLIQVLEHIMYLLCNLTLEPLTPWAPTRPVKPGAPCDMHINKYQTFIIRSYWQIFCHLLCLLTVGPGGPGRPSSPLSPWKQQGHNSMNDKLYDKPDNLSISSVSHNGRRYMIGLRQRLSKSGSDLFLEGPHLEGEHFSFFFLHWSVQLWCCVCPKQKRQNSIYTFSDLSRNSISLRWCNDCCDVLL